ncbi:hypothetical protein L198_05315 [Cryptococcus wingfieldii CBS 7118]|uniref:Uncharacterized protein n=1 Tax=Cryptococcus wingfieldii CBS 7118 TaxID=1295528 RepID=A0A1E3IXV6_9TREE|nr:hypothetical protein L198_05315 [Cryptococcus wingfieldii CBS 7118]ODN93450.1 hypothetical protein L198_05315 [Cryptococcus wingfieldii CBS 7118]
MSSTTTFNSVVHMFGYPSSLTAFTSHWLPPLTTTTCFNIATAAMVLSAITLREMYSEANSLFWVSTLAEADVAFVRTEIFRNLYILSSVIITTLDISHTFTQNLPYSASCGVIIRLAIVCACYSRIALSTKYRNQFPQGPERQTVPRRDDKISMDRVQRERKSGMKEPVGFWADVYGLVASWGAWKKRAVV